MEEEVPAELRRKTRQENGGLSAQEQKQYMRLLYEQGGWSVPSWPVELGGPGWSHEKQYVFERELALNDAPWVPLFGAAMLGPAIIEFGAEVQKAEFLPKILRGEIVWCQGYSEPNAGSDLASLQCRADRDGDEYVLNGSKIWTTEGHIADWMFGLFRTDNSGKKQYGITVLLLEMQTSGIEVEPIITFGGGREVNQTFFTDVRVPSVLELVADPAAAIKRQLQMDFINETHQSQIFIRHRLRAVVCRRAGYINQPTSLSDR